MNKQKLVELMNKLSSLEGSLGKPYIDKVAEDESRNLVDTLKHSPTIKYLDELNSKMEKFKKDFNLTPVFRAVEKLQKDAVSSKKKVAKELEQNFKTQENKYGELGSLIAENCSKVEESSAKQIKELSNKLIGIKNEISLNNSFSKKKEEDLKLSLARVEKRINEIIGGAKNEPLEREKFSRSVDSKFKQSSSSMAETVKSIEELRKEMNRMFSSGRGGAINRQMFIGGVDPLQTYTDMNLVAGSNMTISYANNSTTKKVNVTFASTGGGGSTRSINSVAVDTAAGAAAGTDYVYLVTGTTTITLPTAVGNTNLYTIKNVGTGVVTIATTAAQTIDAAVNITMPVQYTAVDLISDTANWNVT